MRHTYWKVPFIWTVDNGVPELPKLAPGCSWLPAADHSALVDLAAACLPVAVDAWYAAAVADIGADKTAKHLLNDLTGFHHSPAWWKVFIANGEAQGLVLPVLFDGCARGDLEEGTILFVGVRPEARGSGLGRVLLRQAVHDLHERGIWRIYSDTAATNEPMIRLFESEGWARQQPHARPSYRSSRTQ